jgi:hypothetical protein
MNNINATKYKEQSLLETAEKHEKTLYAQGRYQEALDTCLRVVRSHPKIADAWTHAALNRGRLGRWQDAIHYAQTALSQGGNTFSIYDILAYGHDELKQWSEARRYGLQALNMRDRFFGGKPIISLLNLPPLPPLPSAHTRERNIIAFSLFGHNSKYCEPAILNVQEQPNIYPYWVCRFYVDDNVPKSVVDRLRAGGAQIVCVVGPALQWPGEMWRLLVLNDPHAHRMLFRDSDSVISRREAAAAQQWLTSGKRFHMMCDTGSDTELIMAGLWGAVAGSLPPLDKLMGHFMNVPLQSQHFVDQDFLRQYVWPYARTSLMQHDSVFGFMEAVPFPDKDRPEDFHVGDSEGSAWFTRKCNEPDGSEVIWELYWIIEKFSDGGVRAQLICSYTNTVHDGMVKAHIPRRYARWIQQGMAGILLRKLKSQ